MWTDELNCLGVFIKRSVKHGGDSVTVWGCFASPGPGLTKIDGT